MFSLLHCMKLPVHNSDTHFVKCLGFGNEIQPIWNIYLNSPFSTRIVILQCVLYFSILNVYVCVCVCTSVYFSSCCFVSFLQNLAASIIQYFFPKKTTKIIENCSSAFRIVWFCVFFFTFFLSV